MVKDIAMEYKLTKEDIDDLFTEKEAKDMIPEDGKFISFNKMTFDGVQGGAIIYEITAKRLDFEIVSHVTQFIFFYNQKLYTVNCSVALGEEPSKHRAEKFSSLFKLIANSIVINEQY
jgi:hypothetical protein